MPLTRYQIRNEYTLADPELYRAADKDDPEALLEGVAMAGLVGVLRQLGDLAEFAAEIFHDLHEEVMVTAARGHGLMVRVQQLEAEFPSIEKAFLSQTGHSLFFSNAGVDWHPNLRTEQNLITRGDLPRFVMDSYEECRGPPRLFLLDKFDVVGAGACLKRYTDPSFFKVEAASSGVSAVEVQREKKNRKVKKKGSRWRNGETPEIVPTSHTKLQQLLLEERLENGYSDPARLVKLKKRQLNGCPHDSKSGKSYMEKLLKSPSPERKVVCEISVMPPPLKLTSDNSSEAGPEIVEISMVSPMKKSLQRMENPSSSPNARDVVLKPSVDKLNGEVFDRGFMKVPESTADGDTDEIPSTLHKGVVEKEFAVDGEGSIDGSVDGHHTDDMTSEVDNYMDALTTMESEMETDNEYRLKNVPGFLNVGKHGTDSDANEEQLESHAHFSDSLSIGNSSGSDDGSSLFKKGRSIGSYSDTHSNLAENTPSDGEGAIKAFLSNETYVAEIGCMPSNQLPVYSDSLGTKSREFLSPNSVSIYEDEIHDHGEAPCSPCCTDVSPTVLPPDPGARAQVISLVGPELDESPSNGVELGSELPNTDKNGTNLSDFSAVVTGVPSQTRDETHLTDSVESCPVDELDGGYPNVSSDALLHSSNISELAPEKKSSYNSVDKVLQTDYADGNCADNLVNIKVSSPDLINSPTEERFPCSAMAEEEASSGVTLLPYSPDDIKTDDLVSEVDDVVPPIGVNSEIITPMVAPSQILSSKEQCFSDITDDVPQVEVDSTEVVPYSEEKTNFEKILDTAEGGQIGGFNCNVDAVEGDGAPQELPSNYSDNSGHEDHVSLDVIVPETVQAEDAIVSAPATAAVAAAVTAAVAAAVTAGTDDDVGGAVCCPSSDLICSPSRNPMTLQESLSGAEYPHQTELELNETFSPECIVESDAQKKIIQVEGDGAPLELPSNYSDNPGHEDHVSLDVIVTETVQAEDAFVSTPAAPAAAAAVAASTDDDVSGVVCCPSSDLICSPSRNPMTVQESLSAAEYPHQTELELNETFSPECIVESEAQKKINQLEVDPTDLDSTMCKSISYDYLNLENFDDVQDLSLAVGDVTTAPASSELSDQELESICPHQSCLFENNEDDVSSRTCYLPKSGTTLEQSVELPADQPDVECLQADEASSKSSNLQTDQIHSPNHMDQGRCFDSKYDFCPEDLPSQHSSSEILPQSAGQELDGTNQAMDPLDSVLPSFGLLPEATIVSVEEMPPLPPLPPMQWRMGKVQHAPLASDRELAEHSQNSYPVIPPFTANEKSFGFPTSERGIVQPGNPFLPLAAVEDENSQHVSEHLVGNLVQPMPFAMQLPTMVYDANTQNNSLTLQETKSLNPFLMLPAVSNERSEHSILVLEGKMVQSSSNSFSPVGAAEYITSGHEPLSSEGKPIQPLNHVTQKTSLEAKELQHASQDSQDSEGEQGSPHASVLPPANVEEQPQRVLPTSEVETGWSSNTFAPLPAFEGGNSNGNPAIKLPRPRSPLIEAVAAHDKSKLRKVTERVRPQSATNVDERDSLLEQIRAKSFNLKPAAVTRPSIQGPKTNLKVAAILEKANAIRQAFAGSDEDEDADWSDS